MDASRGDLQRQGLHDHIVPGVRRHPGFVSGTWMLDREAAAGVEPVDIRLVEVEASAW